MANEVTKGIMGRIDTATNGIAERIRRLKEAVVPGMTQAEVDEVNAGLETEAQKLEGIAADPDNPVPVDPGTGTTTGGPATDRAAASRQRPPTD